MKNENNALNTRLSMHKLTTLLGNISSFYTRRFSNLKIASAERHYNIMPFLSVYLLLFIVVLMPVNVSPEMFIFDEHIYAKKILKCKLDWASAHSPEARKNAGLRANKIRAEMLKKGLSQKEIECRYSWRVSAAQVKWGSCVTKTTLVGMARKAMAVQ